MLFTPLSNLTKRLYYNVITFAISHFYTFYKLTGPLYKNRIMRLRTRVYLLIPKKNCTFATLLENHIYYGMVK